MILTSFIILNRTFRKTTRLIEWPNIRVHISCNKTLQYYPYFPSTIPHLNTLVDRRRWPIRNSSTICPRGLSQLYRRFSVLTRGLGKLQRTVSPLETFNKIAVAPYKVAMAVRAAVERYRNYLLAWSLNRIFVPAVSDDVCNRRPDSTFLTDRHLYPHLYSLEPRTPVATLLIYEIPCLFVRQYKVLIY